MALNPSQVGAISELVVMTEYAKRGYSVYEPLQPGRADFLAEKNGRFVRVQVKTGTPFAKGREIVGFSQKPYDRSEVDVIAVYDQRANKVYYIPVDHVVGMRAIRIRTEPYKYNVKKEKALDGSCYTKFLG